MGRQSSRIYFQNKDHKEMVTYNGIGYQYHKQAYIWNGRSFELVWEKLKSTAAKIVANLVFAYGQNPPSYSGGFFVGVDPSSEAIIKRKAPSYAREALYFPLSSTQYSSFFRTSTNGKIFWIGLSPDGYARKMSVIDISTDRILTTVDEWYVPPQGAWVRCINIDGGVGTPSIDPLKDNDRIFDNGAGVRYMTACNGGGLNVYTCWYSRDPHTADAGEIYYLSLPTDTYFVAQCDFMNFYAINARAGKMCKFYTPGRNQAIYLVDEFTFPSDVTFQTFLGYGRYSNGRVWVQYSEDYLLFDVVSEAFSKAAVVHGSGFLTQGWSDIIQNSNSAEFYKKVGNDWRPITFDDEPFARNSTHIKGEDIIFCSIQEEEHSANLIYQGYKF